MDEPKSESKVESIIAEAARSVDEATEAVTHQATRAKNSVEQVGGEFNRAVRDSLRQQPMATLTAAVALGFILGAVWKA